jgi:hypothetical protein
MLKTARRRASRQRSFPNYHYLALCVYNISAGEEQCWGGNVAVNIRCVLCVHNSIIVSLHHRVHTVLQWPCSGVHSLTMEKSAQPGAGPPPFTISTIAYKIVVRAPA